MSLLTLKRDQFSTSLFLPHLALLLERLTLSIILFIILVFLSFFLFFAMFRAFIKIRSNFKRVYTAHFAVE